jgi:hypothetical protein
MSERFKKLAAIVAAFIQEKPWTVVKFCLLFAAVTWFVSRNFGGMAVSLLVATVVTLLSIAHWKIFDKASDAFLDVEEHDNAEEKGKKTFIVIAKRIFYTVMDYGLAALSIALVIAMKNLGFSYLATVAAMWLIIDITSASAFVIIYERTGRDMTLGRSYRRMANVIMAHSKIAGVIVFIYETTLASFWAGPDYTVLFWRDELNTRVRLAIALIAITAAHAFLWTAVYWSSYEDIVGLVASIIKG